jgi:MinD-like ATPase involved in chromosome partitioning or flagellar assembly
MAGPGAGNIVTFYSYKGGTGRTMALANTAWIMASNGLKVLAADWDLEAPGLHRYFHPFLDRAAVGATQGISELVSDYASAAVDGRKRPGDWHLEYASALRHAMSLSWDPFPSGGTLDFLSGGRDILDFSPDDWDNFYARLGGEQFIEALRADMKRNYDYVLIDSQTGWSDIPAICTMLIPDIIVVCFTLSDQSIEGAVNAARAVGQDGSESSGRHIRVLPVPMRVDHAEPALLKAGRSLVRSRFGGFPTGLAPWEQAEYWNTVEIPYKSAYAFEESLAVFGDMPGSPSSLLAAFERLTAAITEGRVSALPPMGEGARLRYRQSCSRRGQYQ